MMGLFAKWKACPVEFIHLDHGHSMVSGYYLCKEMEGIKHYKITIKGRWKIREGRLIMDVHNFLVYLGDEHVRKGSDFKLEDGTILK